MTLNINLESVCSDFSYYENGLAGSSETCAGEYLPTPKRHHPHSNSSHLLLQHGGGLLFSPGAGGGGAAASSHPHVPPPPHLHPAADYPQQYGYTPYPGAAHCNPRDSTADLLADRRHGDEEWKNIHVVSCVTRERQVRGSVCRFRCLSGPKSTKSLAVQTLG